MTFTASLVKGSNMGTQHNWEPSHEIMGEMIYICTKCGASVMSDEDRPLDRDCKAHNKRMKLKRRKRARWEARQTECIRQYRRLAHARNWWKPPYIIGQDSPF